MLIDFDKNNGLVPVIIQHDITLQVLMLGYMDQAALEKTTKDRIVTFYSRSKKRLWTKGETSGNYFKVIKMKMDCDADTLLVTVNPMGPACHNGTTSCFGSMETKGFIYALEDKINDRINDNSENSYTSELFKSGINKIAQKVGEEAVELVIEAKDNDQNLFVNEAADLLFHLLILLRAKNTNFQMIEEVLMNRSK